jgi:replication factor C small subunit
MDVLNKVWFEKYRPKTLDELILNDDIRERLQSLIDKDEIQHLLLFGTAGIGKTTLAKILVNTLNCSYLYINASDENGVDTIRYKIKSFVSTYSENKFKIVILDEADFLTIQFQAILRPVMEEFSDVARFILTCNYEERIIEPIRSRCTSIQLSSYSIVDAAKYIIKILDAENIKYDLKDIKPIITSYFPDMRKIVNEIESHSINGVFKLPSETTMTSTYVESIFGILKRKTTNINKDYAEIRTIVDENKIKIFNPLYTQLFKNISTLFNSDIVPDAILAIAESQFQDTLVFDKEITFIACIIKLLTIKKG